METSLLTMLPDLSLNVVSIVGLIYVVMKFLDALDRRTIQHAEAMKERELALRQVEKDVRDSLYRHISESTFALQENTKVLSRVISHLDTK
jgi:hypothetical protein